MLASLVRLLCGVQSVELPPGLVRESVVFFANHSSHLDFAVIWASLEASLRRRTRPVAGRDYWTRGPVRRWLANRVFNAVLIERHRVTVANNPLQPMVAALDSGANLIVFPEGTRGNGIEVGPFRPGLYHLARTRPETVLVPTHLENLNRIMPRGALLPVPLIARVAFGAPMRFQPDEAKDSFLNRARSAVIALHAH